MITKTQIAESQPTKNDDQILAAFVDAMLDAQTLLDEASGDEWRQILRVSCRRQRRSIGGSDTGSDTMVAV